MEIFKLFGSILINTDEADKSLSKTEKSAGSFASKLGKGITTAAKWGVGIVAAAGAAGVALSNMAKKSAEATDRIDKMSQKIGISREAFQELDYICSQNGMSVDQLQGNVKKMVNVMDDAANGSETAAQKFSRLGISVTDANGNLKTSEDMFYETISALQSMTDETERNAAANDIFGGSYTEMIPLLNSGTESMEELRQKAHDMGLVLSDETIDAGVKFTDTMDTAKRSLSAIGTNIGGEVMPIFQQFLDWILGKMPEIQSVLKVVFSVIETFVTTAGDIIRSFLAILRENAESSGITFAGVFTAIQTAVTTAFRVIQTIWNTIGKPCFDAVKLVIGTIASYFADRMPAISGFVKTAFSDIQQIWINNLKPCLEAIGNFIKNVLAPAFKFVFNNVIAPVVDAAFKMIKGLWTGTLKPVLSGIIDFLTGVFTGNWKKAFKGLANIVKGVFNGLITVVKAPLNAVIGIINKFINGVNKLKIPDWVPGVGGKNPNISSIPLLAKGGTVTASGRVIVGEAGPEELELPVGATVRPLTDKNTAFGTEKVEELLELILTALKLLNEELYDIMVDALVNGVKLVVNGREIGRLVRKYA